MAARASRRRSRGAGKREYVWTALRMPGTSVTTATDLLLSIVLPADWIGAGGFERGTLERIRGWLAFLPTLASQTYQWNAYIAILDAQAASGSAVVTTPSNVAAYVDEDILWTGGGVVRTDATMATQHGYGNNNIVIDVAARRKIDASKQVALVVRAVDNSGTFNVYGLLRGLVSQR